MFPKSRPIIYGGDILSSQYSRLDQSDVCLEESE